MKDYKKHTLIVVLTILLVLLIDQLIKIYVKTHFILGEEYHIAGNWFIIHFTENAGMAFGMEFGGNYGKIILSVFRILAALFGIYYIAQIIKSRQHLGYIMSVSLIFAGAVGNIIDSLFYGIIFNSSEFQVAQFMPADGGYADFLHGHVVDMLYFPLLEGTFPSWFPIWGGEPFQFFRPVFNFADASISIGVMLILLFQKKFFPRELPQNPDQIQNKPAEQAHSEG